MCLTTTLFTRLRSIPIASNSNTIEASTIRIGFWGVYYTILMIRNPRNGIGNSLGPYITPGFSRRCSWAEPLAEISFLSLRPWPRRAPSSPRFRVLGFRGFQENPKKHEWLNVTAVKLAPKTPRAIANCRAKLTTLVGRKVCLQPWACKSGPTVLGSFQSQQQHKTIAAAAREAAPTVGF